MRPARADLALGAQFALGCLAAPAGPTRDVLFQLAFAAYVGACFNLNPFLGRDGYQILVDVLREPNLRRRAREQFARRLARQPDAGDSRLLVRYKVLALAWSVVAVGFAVASESAREELADEQAALRSMATLVAPSVPPGEILLRSAVRPERCWMSTARASCAAWGEEVEGPGGDRATRSASRPKLWRCTARTWMLDRMTPNAASKCQGTPYA